MIRTNEDNEKIVPAPKSRFLRVKCADCEHEQVIFGNASTVVTCDVCGRRSRILTHILEVLE